MRLFSGRRWDGRHGDRSRGRGDFSAGGVRGGGATADTDIPASSHRDRGTATDAGRDQFGHGRQLRLWSRRDQRAGRHDVTWTNADVEQHTVTARDRAYNSDIVANGKTFSFSFANPGTYQYFCQIHPSMVGAVVVTPK